MHKLDGVKTGIINEIEMLRRDMRRILAEKW